jgi:SNF2 family DNA or RNA helicase
LQERKGLRGPHLIVCPKAVLPNWAAEFAAWAPELEVILYDGRPDECALLRGRVMAGAGGRGFCVLLTHYDLILRDKGVLAKPHWSYIIVDEGHRMKNHESRLAEVMAASYRSKHRLLLTGTPIQNNMGELWALLNFLLPAIFHSAESFESWFNAPFAGTKEDVALNEEEELVVINRLHAVLRPFLLRRRKAEVESQLPAKVEVVLKADMSAWQRHYYRSIVEEKRVETAGGAASLMNGAMQLRKCCNHPYLFLAADGYEPTDPNELIRASGKLELLHRILPKLKASGHRVLLFSQMTALLNILEDYLAGRGYSYLRLDGNTGTAARGEMLASFNAPDSPNFLFLLSTRAGGMGLNLQSADTVIMFDSGTTGSFHSFILPRPSCR